MADVMEMQSRISGASLRREDMGGPDPDSSSLGWCWSHSPLQVDVRLARHLAAQSNLRRPVHGEHQG